MNIVIIIIVIIIIIIIVVVVPLLVVFAYLARANCRFLQRRIKVRMVGIIERMRWKTRSDNQKIANNGYRRRQYANQRCNPGQGSSLSHCGSGNATAAMSTTIPVRMMGAKIA
jgi:hypothetical protein